MNLKETCKNVRCNIVEAIGSVGVGHIGGCLSIAEVLTVLYFKHMNIDPSNPKKPGRDRLVLSKGHAGPALYAALAERGYFDKSKLTTLNAGGTMLPSHCDMNLTPGVDMTAGSLGQGFSCAVGAAIGSKLKGDGAVIYVIIGDGESQEGQIWEAAMYAAQKKLDNLIVFTDYNTYQIDGSLGEICELKPLDKKWRAFGFDVISVKDGNDVASVDRAVTRAKALKNQRPKMIILHTVKGKGIRDIEALKVGNHSANISKEQAAQYKEEIMRGLYDVRK